MLWTETLSLLWMAMQALQMYQMTGAVRSYWVANGVLEKEEDVLHWIVIEVPAAPAGGCL
jgi:hypothetical protein